MAGWWCWEGGGESVAQWTEPSSGINYNYFTWVLLSINTERAIMDRPGVGRLAGHAVPSVGLLQERSEPSW